MQVRTAEGLKLNKTQLYRDLALKNGRTPRSWAFSMQNVSHVLDQLKEDWIEGPKQAKNGGPEVTGLLVMLLTDGPPSSVSPATLPQLEQQRRLVDESGYFPPENVEDDRSRDAAR